MQWLRLLYVSGLVAVTLVLSACGGGGTSADVFPGAARTVTPTTGPDSFLLFPNPQKQDDGTLQVATQAYATAYYEAIDPGNERDTLAKFKAKNGFGTAAGALGEETVIVGDQRDLGYGRKMTARQNVDGSLAFVVENYMVGAYGAYSSLNLDAAVVAEAKWHLGTNGIEFSPGYDPTCTGAVAPAPNPASAKLCSTNFVKFYTFDPVTGARLSMGNLDGRGYKALPTVCASCHGGRGDPLTPAAGSPTGKALFAKLLNARSKADLLAPAVGGVRGDMGAQLHPFEPASFDYSTTPAFTRAMQESKLKTVNKMVLCSFPNPGAAAGDDACRPTAVFDEYQGTVAAHLKDMYGGGATTLQNATSSATDTYVPTAWLDATTGVAGTSNLYLATQAEACRVCHLLRGTGNQSDINFDTYAKFDGYEDRIKAHILDRGNMPLAKLIYDKFWATPSIYTPMGTFLTSKGYTNTTTQPGRPVADPGPDRVIQDSTTVLSAANSLFSTSYLWTVTSGAATLSDASAVAPTFTATGGNGTYTVQLVTSRGTTSSVAKTLSIKVDSALTWDPVDLRFLDIKTILTGSGGATTDCSACHVTNGGPPISYVGGIDRNESGGAGDATDDQWFYTELRGRINFTDIVASPLLRKPSGNHHGGGTVLNIAAKLPGDPDPDRAAYDKLQGWILNGAPY